MLISTGRFSCFEYPTVADFVGAGVMAEPMVVDVVDLTSPKGPDPEKDVAAKKTLKRKRASPVAWESPEEKEAKIKALREEMEGLFRYYKEGMENRVIENGESVMHGVSMNSTIACLMEESSLPLSKLVDEIFAKINAMPDGVKNNAESVSKVGVKSAVILVGQRMFYGIPSADADVLEDESETALWCWEVKFQSFYLAKSNLIFWSCISI